MTTLYQDIRGALQTRLASVPGIPTIAYEGKPFTPVPGTPFVACQLVPTSARPATSGEQHLVLHEGNFEISVSYPAGKGTAVAEAMADTIKSFFRAGTPGLTLNGNTVRLIFAERRQALHDPLWVRVPVSVGWFLHSETY